MTIRLALRAMPVDVRSDTLCTMDKPVIFFSHSSRDEATLSRLKDLFVERTGGAVEVFLSSDGSSIPFGRNWVRSIQDALERAQIMMVFLTPNSLRSNWIFFESGFAYSKDVRVVPIGIMGVDLSKVPPPMSLLQGFNVVSPASLGNIIAVVNEELQHQHSTTFSDAEYKSVFQATGAADSALLGEHHELVEEIRITLRADSGLEISGREGVAAFRKEAEQRGFTAEGKGKKLHLHGVTIVAEDESTRSGEILIVLEPAVADEMLPVLEAGIRAVQGGSLEGTTLRLGFIPGIEAIEERHKLSGRLHRHGVGLGPGSTLRLGDLLFYIDHYLALAGGGPTRGAAYLGCTVPDSGVPITQIRELLALLVEESILFERSF